MPGGLVLQKLTHVGPASEGLEAVKRATAAAETVAPIVLFNPRLARWVVFLWSSYVVIDCNKASDNMSILCIMGTAHTKRLAQADKCMYVKHGMLISLSTIMPFVPVVYYLVSGSSHFMTWLVMQWRRRSRLECAEAD